MSREYSAATLITIPEVAKILGCAEQTIYNRTARKAKNPFPVRPVRIGRSIRFSLAAIMEFIETGGENLGGK